MKLHKQWIIWALAFILSTGYFAFSHYPAISSSDSGNRKPIVYTTFYALEDLVQQVAGEQFEVRSFLPPDADLHHWIPTDADYAKLSEADLFFANGAGLEPWLAELKAKLPDLEIAVLSKGLDLIKLKSENGESDYKYRAAYSFTTETHLLDFGHTHEPSMQIGFMKNDGLSEEEIDRNGRLIMALDPQTVAQEETVAITDRSFYNLEMGHESGKIYLSFSEAGEWIVFVDRTSSDNLPYVFVDPSDESMSPSFEHEKEDEDMQITYDPHVWLSFSGARHFAKSAARALTSLNADAGESIKENRSILNKRLKNLEKEFDEKFENLEKRDFAVTDPAFGYLAREFRLKQFALPEQPDAAASLCGEHNTTVIFYTDALSSQFSETVAQLVNGTAIQLSTAEKMTENKETDFVDLLEENATKIFSALAGISQTAALEPIPASGGSAQSDGIASNTEDDKTIDQKPIMEDDIYLEDWEGAWNSLGAYVDSPDLQEWIEKFASAENKTVEDVKASFEEKRKCDFGKLVIDSDTVTFYDSFESQDAKELGKAIFEYVGTYQVKHGRFKTDWYAFQTDDPEAPYPFLLMMPIHGEESLTHFHLRYGTELKPLLIAEGWFPTFVKPNATPEQLIKGFTE